MREVGAGAVSLAGEPYQCATARLEDSQLTVELLDKMDEVLIKSGIRRSSVWQGSLKYYDNYGHLEIDRYCTGLSIGQNSGIVTFRLSDV